jgi:TolB-like protein
VRYPLLVGGVAAAILLALLFGLNAGGLRERLLGRASAARAAAGHIRSLAVLPLEDLSKDPEQEYFADGMTEALITDLGKLGGLRVISRTSSMHYKGTRKTLPEIARELNVDAVIEGAVLRSGNRVRITTQLVEASTDRHLWAETYERDLRDLLALQGEVAREVARQVDVELTPQEQTRLLRRPPVDPEAMEVYLKGRYDLSGAQFDQGIEHFKQALHKEPNYAQAWAGLAEAYDSLSYGFASQFRPKLPAGLAETRAFNTELLAKAKAAAIKALQLDQSLSQAHVSLGEVLMDVDWSWSAAEKEFQRAIILDPSNAFAHSEYGENLMAWGRLDEAVAELNRARVLDPLSFRTEVFLARTFSAAGRYDEALQHWREVFALGGPMAYAWHRRMAIAYEGKGMEQEAVAELVTALKASAKEHGSRRYQDLATVVLQKYASSGYAEAKKAFLRGGIIRENAIGFYVGPIYMAEDYAELGENDKAFEWLDKLIQSKTPGRKWIKVDERLKVLRADPRFRDLVRNLGFPH